MTQPGRTLLFVLLAAMLGLLYWHIYPTFAAINPAAASVLFATLFLLAFSILLLEHWFTKPTDALSSSIAVLLALVPARASLVEMQPWLDAISIFAALIGTLAALSIILNRPGRGDSKLQGISETLKAISVRLGSSRVLFAATFFASALSFYADQGASIVALMIFSVIVLAIDPKSLPSSFSKVSTAEALIGDVIGVQSRNTVIARLNEDRPAVQRYDFVEFRLRSGDKSVRRGIITDNWVLESEQRAKVYSNNLIMGSLSEVASDPKLRPGEMRKLSLADDYPITQKFVGTVYAGSTISEIRFDHGIKVPVQEGSLLQIPFGGSNVLYQVTEGVTKIETLDSQNETGLIIGTAVQIGQWDADGRQFNRHGWVPEINQPVLKAEDIEAVMPIDGEHLCGCVPNTNYPVFLNKFDAISHHTAILGVTGTGKSVFARDLIRRIAEDGVKVLVVDFTEEYRAKLPAGSFRPILAPAIENDVYTQVDILSNELAKFENQRSQAVIDHAEGELRDRFGPALDEFLLADENIALVELPDVENSGSILSFTRWLLKTLFEKAKAQDIHGRRVCIVLEEAHTVVPEWNFMSTEDKTAKSLVNQIGQIALQGRKYGVGFFVIAQRTANVSKTVLTQCNSIIAFKQFDKTSYEFLANYMGESMASSVGKLQHRHAIAVGKAFRSNAPMIFKVPEINEDGDLE